MSTPAKPALSPIALKQGEGEALWFFGSLAIVKAGSETIAGRVSVTELLGRQGSGSPLHVHHREDEWFYILEGELTFWVGGRIIKAPSRVVRVWSARHPPHLHSHVARSAQPRGHRACRVRKVHVHAGEPAAALTIPPASVALPSPDRIKAAAAEFGLEILGPPGIPS